ncbi:MAG: beta-1,6-glucan synthase [Rhodocyclaceae bacterium]|nr:beta-1,6-glucan synthase [Rhodocyclaceae bacterium]
MTADPIADRRWHAMLCLHLGLALALGAWLLWKTRPVALPEAPGARIQCLSYSPFRGPDRSPLVAGAPVEVERIRHDLAAIAAVSGCVRIYAVDLGLDAVPAVAEELGMAVIVGAWIGRDGAANRRQVEAAVALARAHPRSVRALMIGNEVLLRREQTAGQLAAMLDEVRRQVSVPVSYADVWEFWLRHPELAAAVDFVTVHILPFWEDHPVAAEHAVAHVVAVHRRVAAVFDKPVLIGESGWPSAGRQRGPAVPGRIEQARFVREFLAAAAREEWRYNLIEAFDQPWKRRLEGTVGGFWGIFDGADRLHFPLTGAVAPRPAVGAAPATALAAALLIGLLAASIGRSSLQVAAFAATGLWSGMAGAMLLEHAWLAWRDATEWWVLGAVSALGPCWLGLRVLVPRLVGDARRLCGWLHLAIIFCAALAALWLAVDPRYRDFPLWMYAGVAPALLLIGEATGPRQREAIRICAIVVALAGLARLLPEPDNREAVAWSLLCLVLAAGGWFAGQQQQRQ